MKKRNIIIATSAVMAVIVIVLIIVFTQSKPSSEIQEERPSASPTQAETIPSKDLENNDPQKPQQTASPEPTKQKEPLKVNRDNYDPYSGLIKGNVENYLEEIEKNEESKLTKKTDIPIYDYEELILGKRAELEDDEINGYGHYICFFPGIDQGVWKDKNSSVNYFTEVLLAAFPSNAWRDMGDGRKYLMYDTDKGARLFLFFDDSNNYSYYLGFPVIMTEKVSYEEMKGLKIGDTIDDVLSIDSSAQCLKESRYYAPDAWIEYHTSLGCPTTTVHILTDGVMKITYERTGEKDNYVYTITDIQYHENFDIECIEGTFNYKIAEIDYVD